METRQFRRMIWSHYKERGRHDLPWRKTRDPYRILVSEIMLQQTQVARAMSFYKDFIKRFPNFRALARAKTADVLRAWQGLGYNRRALNLQRLSSIVLEKFNGRLPRKRGVLETLPGIGKGTSGSLCAFAFNEPEVFIETNIRRVFIHFFFSGKKKSRKTVTDRELERYIKSTIDLKNPREWYFALMDYGAMLGTTGKKAHNPNRRSAHYKKQALFKGSGRELRGKMLRALLRHHSFSLDQFSKQNSEPAKRIKEVARALVREGFASAQGDMISVSA